MIGLCFLWLTMKNNYFPQSRLNAGRLSRHTLRLRFALTKDTLLFVRHPITCRQAFLIIDTHFCSISDCMIEFLHGIQRENNTVKPDEHFQQASNENLKR